MIRRIWIKNFRMLASNRVDVAPFDVLVGRNASGKSTLMSALRFVSAVLRDGVPRAIDLALDGAGQTFADLCFDPEEPIQIALVVELSKRHYRYELEVGIHEQDGPVVLRENLFLVPDGGAPQDSSQGSLFGDEATDEVVHQEARRESNWRKIVGKAAGGKDYFRDEKTQWNNQFRFGPTRSALGNIPEDLDRFPGAISVRNLLRDGIQMVELDSHKLRMPSPPRSPIALLSDGSNLANAAHELRRVDSVAFEQWVSHVAEFVPGLQEIDTWERPEDKHVVLRARFGGVHEAPVPSWLLSDGTLRLLALTLLAFAEPPDHHGMVLIEEPENGLHPLAITGVFQALSQMRSTQVFVATHSPVFLAQTTMDQVLVFRRDPRGFSQIRRGMEVAELEGWRSRVSVADLLATGAMVGDGGANSTKNKSRLVRAGSDLDTRRSRGGLAMTMSPGGRAVKAGRARTAKDPT